MIELILVGVFGMFVGGAIVELFKPKIDADVAAIVEAYKDEVAKLTAAHKTAVVAAVQAATPAAAA